MYTPPSFREERPDVLRAIITANPFATLVCTGADGPEATHLPLLLSQDGTCLRGHMARANDQWRYLVGQPAGQPVNGHADRHALTIFHGPHAYISPTYYEADFAVPTWNYVAVHAAGPVRLLEDPQAVRALLDDLVASSDRHGWTMPWQDSRADGLLAAIVAFELEIQTITGKAKLGQNRSAEDQLGVARALQTSDHPGDQALAVYMKENAP